MLRANRSPVGARSRSPWSARWTSVRGCPASCWSASPIPPPARCASACGRRCATPDSSCPTASVTVNLAPAERRKEGASCDLAVALGVLAATLQVPAERLARHRRDRRAGARRRAARCARHAGPGRVRRWRAGATRRCCARPARRPRRRWSSRLAVHPVATLDEAVEWLRGDDLPAPGAGAAGRATPSATMDLADVRGQAVARRALEIAAAGGHHLLHGRAARRRQVDARAPAPRHPPAARAGRGAGRDAPPLRRRPARPRPRPDAPASVPLAASLGDARRADRRRQPAAAGRDLARAPRRAVPRRAVASTRARLLEALREPLETGAVHLVACQRRTSCSRRAASSWRQ